MSTSLKVRFIPAWLNSVIGHYGADVLDFQRIVSKHDVKNYKLANHLLMSKLRVLGIDKDYEFTDAEVVGPYESDDAMLALYGANPSQTDSIGNYRLDRFKIYYDNAGGILLIEDVSIEKRDLVEELLNAIALYKGEQTAYQSSSFVKLLAKRNK